MRIPAFELDSGETDGLRSSDPLTFPGYAAVLADLPEEPCLIAIGRVHDQPVVALDLDFSILGGTMGTVVGERIVHAFDLAAELRRPLVASISTGGARLQEGMFSLIQMARTTAAARRHHAAGLLSVGILRSPTTGGVYASWSSLLDVRAGAAGATIGFGGPRVVERVTGQLPPPTSHTAESAHASGLLDAVLAPEQEEEWLGAVLGASRYPLQLSRERAFRSDAAPTGGPAVKAARDPRRPSGLQWVSVLTESWVSLAGADPTIRTGLAEIAGRRVVVVAMDRHARGDAAARPGPRAFRQAQRAIQLAGHLSAPLLTIVDTPGAEPGPVAEADGLAMEIARTLAAMNDVPVPTVSLCVGEGGSGGAMALAHADALLMLEDAIFEVMGPEAAAVVLTRDAERAPEIAAAMHLSAPELVADGLADAALPWSHAQAADIRAVILAHLDDIPGARHVRINNATRRALRVPATAA